MLPPSPVHQPLGDARSPVKKALLIGICYRTRVVVDDYVHLSAPHSDVENLRDMLIQRYGYEEQNITVMLDRQDLMEQNPHLAPMRDNILREVAGLVRGAQRGDIFVFHFSGHCDQIECKNGSEDDGLDEVMLPMDHEGLKEKFVRDNKLRKLLVNPLPVGAHLTAILDSCHSGTLLDLDHYACMNGTQSIHSRRPTISRGPQRRKANSLSSSRSRIVHSYRINDTEVRSRESSIHSQPGTPRKLSVKTRTSSIHTCPDGRSMSINQVMETIGNSLASESETLPKDEPSPVDDERYILGDSNRRCFSPTPTSTSSCSVSTCVNSPTLRASVISLSACEDSETVWDDPNDFSMTKAVIEVLKEDPHPLLHDLVERVAIRLHKCATELHEWSRNRQESYNERERDRQARGSADENSEPEKLPVIELSARWHPHIGSLKHLNTQEHRLIL